MGDKIRCVLVLGGPQEEWIHEAPPLQADDFIIACDSGYPGALQCGWNPQMAVGDFDSYCGAVAPGVQKISVPPEKDDTDASLGAKLALERGIRNFLIVGALGGRLDHTIANLQMLSWLKAQGAEAQIYSAKSRIWVLQEEAFFLPKMEGWYLSVFAWGGPCQVTLKGVAYPLTDYQMIPTFPIGVSNEFTEETAQIRVTNGTLLVIASRKE